MKKHRHESIFSFIEYLQIEKNCSENTITTYKRDLEHFSLFMVEQGLELFTDIQYFDARLYLTHLYEGNYARASAARKISCLRSFYNFLLREEKVNENPFALVIQPKAGIKLPNFFYEEEMKLLFEACSETTPLGIRNRALLELLYATGIRVSECANIQLNDLDLDFSTVLVKGKGRKERYVPFGSFAFDALLAYINEVREELVKGKEHSYLFVNSRGRTPYTKGNPLHSK